MSGSVDVSVILPTLNEVEALQLLHDPLLASLAPYRFEILVVDDASVDGTISLVERWATKEPFRLIERAGRRGLATAVHDGLNASRGRAIVVMDADGSHEPRSISSLLNPVLGGSAEFVLGSRHVPGGSSPGLTAWRRLVSWGAALLARPLSEVRDPMSGYFALDRRILGRAPLTPVGYKIGLEILVKTRPAPMLEVPIHFAPRAAGQSKLDRVQFAGYLRHLGRLYWWRIFGRRPRRGAVPAR